MAEELSAEDQQRRRALMRELMPGTPFIADLGITVERWDGDEAVLRLPFAERLTNDGASYHGGVVASLMDTAGAAAVWAGHDFAKGARAATVSITVNYTGAARSSDLLASARCVKRGRDLAFSEIHVHDAGGRPVATGTLVYRIVP